MRGVMEKELNQYFKTPIGYIFIAAFLLISGVYFFLVNLVSQNGDIKAFFSSLSGVLLFLIPILTMRIFSEERRQRTDELILTAPVSITAIIVGKFLAALLVFLIPLAVTLCYGAVLMLLGAFWPLETVLGYFGTILLAASFISIGLFISVLFESQLMAAVVSYAVLLILSVSGSAAGGDAFLGKVLSFVSLNRHFEGFGFGIFNPADVVYFLSVTGLCLFLSIYVLERKRLD